jgi:hypothetical protein
MDKRRRTAVLSHAKKSANKLKKKKRSKKAVTAAIVFSAAILAGVAARKLRVSPRVLPPLPPKNESVSDKMKTKDQLKVALGQIDQWVSGNAPTIYCAGPQIQPNRWIHMLITSPYVGPFCNKASIHIMDEDLGIYAPNATTIEVGSWDKRNNFTSGLWSLPSTPKRFIFGVLKIQVGSTRHANYLFFDTKEHTCERVEPYGFHGDQMDEVTNAVCEKMLGMIGYKYIPPYIGCPRIGPQTLASLEHHTKYKKCTSGGYCVTWSLLYANLRLMVPESTPQKIANALMNTYTPARLGDLILKYTDAIAQAFPDMFVDVERL